MTTPPAPTSRPRLRRLLVGGAVALTSLAALVPTGAPAGAIAPTTPDIVGALPYDGPGPAASHVITWSAPEDDGGKPVIEYHIERWNADLTEKLQSYTQSAASGPSRTLSGLPEQVSFRYRIRARNADGWSGFSGFEGVYATASDHFLRPIIDPHDFVERQVDDFAVPLTVGQQSTWATNLQTRDDVVELIDVLASHGTRQRRAEVVRLYFAYFDRAAEPAGLDYWEGRLESGTATLTTVSEFFAKSQEFKTLYGGTTNTKFVTLVYQNVLFRDPAPNEVAYWKGRLDQGTTTRGKLMIGFSESPEGKALRGADVVIADVYATMMGKAASNELVEAYEGVIRANGSPGDFGVLLLPLNGYPH
jgi:hypothetical protein